MERRNVGSACVAEFTVNFVGKQKQVVFLYNIPDLVHLLLGIEISGRVIGVADKYAFGLFCNEFLEFFNRGEGEAFIYVGGHGNDFRAG